MCSFLIITVRSRSKVSNLKSQRAVLLPKPTVTGLQVVTANILGFHASVIFSPIPQAGLTHVRVGPAPWTGTRFWQIRCIYSCLPSVVHPWCENMLAGFSSTLALVMGSRRSMLQESATYINQVYVYIYSIHVDYTQ